MRKDRNLERQLGTWMRESIISDNPPYYRLHGDIAEFFTMMMGLKATIAEELARTLIVFCIDDSFVERERLEQKLSLCEESIWEQLGRYRREELAEYQAQ